MKSPIKSTRSSPSPEEFFTVLVRLKKQSDLKQLDIELDGLSTKRNEALKPINDEAIDLQNKRQAIIDELTK